MIDRERQDFLVRVSELYERGASQRELADGIGVSSKTIGKWVRLGNEERDRRARQRSGGGEG